MASRADLSEFESSSKRRKYDSSDIEDSDNCPESDYGQYSTSSESQFDACEGVSTDSGFNEVSQYDTESQESTQSYPESPAFFKDNSSLNEKIDRLITMRNFMSESLWHELASQLFAPPPRQKLPYINRLADVVRLIRNSRNIIVLTGAGVSVSCGIPDFRSRDGIYARLAQDFPDLPDPHAMFDSSYFRQDPRPFFKFAREIYPGSFVPSPCHRFMAALENHDKLLRNYTQNIDTLERAAGISRVVECHGSFARAECTRCGRSVRAEEIRDDVFAQRIPVCNVCNPDATSVPATDDVDFKELVANGVMKPSIVFFGEGLPNRFYKCIHADRGVCDLLLVIGSSLKVRPVAEIPSSLPRNIPQILINRERLPHCNFDVELLGDSDVIVNQLCHMLGDSWNNVCYSEPLKRTPHFVFPKDIVMPTINDFTDSTLSELDPIEDDSDFGDDKIELSSKQEGPVDTETDEVSMSSVPKSENDSISISDSSCENTTDGDSIQDLNESLMKNKCIEITSCEIMKSKSDPLSCKTSEMYKLPNCPQRSDSIESAESGIGCSETGLISPFCPSDAAVPDSSNESISTEYSNNIDFEGVNITSYSNMSEQSNSSFYGSMDNDYSSDRSPLETEMSGSIENLSETDGFQEPETSFPYDVLSDENFNFGRLKLNLSECLPPNSYYFRRPNIYIFPGAELKMKRKYLKCFKR